MVQQEHARQLDRHARSTTSLIEMFWVDARDYISAMTSADFAVFFRSGAQSRNSQVARFLRETGHNAAEAPETLRPHFLDWLRQTHLEANKIAVRKLSSAQKWMLDTFIADHLPGQIATFDSEVLHFDDWLLATRKEVKSKREQFAAFGIHGIHLDEVFREPSDPHERRYRKDAHAAFIAAHPVLRRLQSEGWNFDASTPGELGRVLDHLSQTVPGGMLQLVYFISPESAQHKAMTRDISAAWKERGGGKPHYLLQEDIRQFMQNQQGQTVILVGHIDGVKFVMDRGQDQAPLFIDIPEMLQAAEDNQVLLLPVGCNSAGTGAYFGFTRNINTIEVAKFIAAIPATAVTIGDVLAALARIGSVWVNAAGMADHLDIIVRQRDSDRNSEGEREPISYVRVPVRFPVTATTPTSSAASANYEAFTAEWIERHRAWYDRGVIGALCREFRAAPIAATLLLAALCACMQGLIYVIQQALDHAHPNTLRRLGIAAATFNVLWVVILLVTFIYVYWLVILFFIAMFALGILGDIFIAKTKKAN